VSDLVESSSQLERLAACAASGALPQTRTVTPWSERGRVVHAFLERARTVGREDALVDVPEEYRSLCEAIDLDALPKGTWAAEVALALNVYAGTVRELGRGADRADLYASVDPLTEIPGTLDAVAVSFDAVLVPDWKTGWAPIAPPARNHQLRFNALLAARAFDRWHAVVEIVRIREDGSVHRQRAELDAFELVVVQQEVRAVHEKVQAARALYAEKGEAALQPVEGPWCRYCPAYPHCPSKKTLALRVAAGDEDDAAQLELLTDEVVARVWVRIQEARAFLGHVEQRMREYAYGRPVHLGPAGKPGIWLGRIEKPGNELLDGRTAWAVLAEMRGQKIADEVVEVYCSKKAVEQAVRKTLDKAKKEKISKATESVIDEIRRRPGGVTRKPSSTVGEYPGPAPVQQLEEGEG